MSNNIDTGHSYNLKECILNTNHRMTSTVLIPSKSLLEPLPSAI